MGFFDDALLVGGGLAFAEHEHHKHQMQRQVLNSSLNSSGPYSVQQQGGLGRSMPGPYDQNNDYQGYGQNGFNQGYGGQDMITVPRSEWDRLQRDAAEGRQQMQRYVEKMESLEQERREIRAQKA